MIIIKNEFKIFLFIFSYQQNMTEKYYEKKVINDGWDGMNDYNEDLKH